MHHKYDGIFLSHTSEDKPFVRRLKESLENHGVTKVWLDEAEIQIGDSLIQKIDEGLRMTILDRLMHRSVLADFQGRSYRLKQAAGRLAKDHDIG
jgi:hypothetical protein